MGGNPKSHLRFTRQKSVPIVSIKNLSGDFLGTIKGHEVIPARGSLFDSSCLEEIWSFLDSRPVPRNCRKHKTGLGFYLYERKKGRKTDIWAVYQKSEFLGRILWQSGWRRYVVEIAKEHRYDVARILEIQDFLDTAMENRRASQ